MREIANVNYLKICVLLNTTEIKHVETGKYIRTCFPTGSFVERCWQLEKRANLIKI